jgi:hypothetical protein
MDKADLLAAAILLLQAISTAIDVINLRKRGKK